MINVSKNAIDISIYYCLLLKYNLVANNFVMKDIQQTQSRYWESWESWKSYFSIFLVKGQRLHRFQTFLNFNFPHCPVRIFRQDVKVLRILSVGRNADILFI